jgi:hypothetical protein
MLLLKIIKQQVLLLFSLEKKRLILFSNCLFLILFLLIIPDYGVGRNSLSEAETNRFCNQFS